MIVGTVISTTVVHNSGSAFWSICKARKSSRINFHRRVSPHTYGKENTYWQNKKLCHPCSNIKMMLYLLLQINIKNWTGELQTWIPNLSSFYRGKLEHPQCQKIQNINDQTWAQRSQWKCCRNEKAIIWHTYHSWMHVSWTLEVPTTKRGHLRVLQPQFFGIVHQEKKDIRIHPEDCTMNIVTLLHRNNQTFRKIYRHLGKL